MWKNNPLLAAGLDGCKAGWWAWLVPESGPWIGQLFPSLEAFWQVAQDHSPTVLIDMPIGLHSQSTGLRECDAWARHQLGARRSSIFIPPVRPTLATIKEGDTSTAAYRRACEANRVATGKQISKQAFFISFKMKALDTFLLSTPTSQSVLSEAHPELAFQWLKGSPLTHGKKTTAGKEERLALLTRHLPKATAWLETARKGYKKSQAQDDDMLDALVLALLATEQLAPLRDYPDPAPTDAEDLPMRMRLPQFSE